MSNQPIPPSPLGGLPDLLKEFADYYNSYLNDIIELDSSIDSLHHHFVLYMASLSSYFERHQVTDVDKNLIPVLARLESYYQMTVIPPTNPAWLKIKKSQFMNTATINRIISESGPEGLLKLYDELVNYAQERIGLIAQIFQILPLSPQQRSYRPEIFLRDQIGYVRTLEGPVQHDLHTVLFALSGKTMPDEPPSPLLTHQGFDSAPTNRPDGLSEEGVVKRIRDFCREHHDDIDNACKYFYARHLAELRTQLPIIGEHTPSDSQDALANEQIQRRDPRTLPDPLAVIEWLITPLHTDDDRPNPLATLGAEICAARASSRWAQTAVRRPALFTSRYITHLGTNEIFENGFVEEMRTSRTLGEMFFGNRRESTARTAKGNSRYSNVRNSERSH